ncbi:unnamed protein product [Moneuplotes crassus]|uniref:Uncharacterized protein n=1 Tax=Euplotes crassus TaxID=5936 RepID=A0AAD1XVM3_EUPCR|nr:unnamed protein product [Moneuplotes crassus]
MQVRLMRIRVLWQFLCTCCIFQVWFLSDYHHDQSTKVLNEFFVIWEKSCSFWKLTTVVFILEV